MTPPAVEAALRAEWARVRGTEAIAGHLGRAWPLLAAAAYGTWEAERATYAAMAEFLLRERAKLDDYDRLAAALTDLLGALDTFGRAALGDGVPDLPRLHRTYTHARAVLAGATATTA